VWQDACHAFSASTFNVAPGIRVKFIGESGVDGGGPRREFYRLLVEAVCSTSGLLEGSDGNKIPLHNCTALKAKKFFLLGVMVSCQPSNDGLTFGNRFSAQIEGLTSLWSTSGSCLNHRSLKLAAMLDLSRKT